MLFARFPPPRAPLPSQRIARILPLVMLASAGGCERGKPATLRDSTGLVTAATADATVTTRSTNGWNAAAGPALLVQGATRDEAIVLFPAGTDSAAVAQLDSASLSEVPVTLFGRGGTRVLAQLGAPTGEGTDECERWPLRGLQPVGAGTAWSVGFLSRRVAPLYLDSVSVLSARDSMNLVAEVSRLASSVIAPTATIFQGLRFSVQDVRRFQAAPGVQALVAVLSRRINQEANPQEEQTVLVAERDSGAATGQYQLAYAERSFGREEQLTSAEVLAGVRIGPAGEPTLVVARDSDDGIVYTLLERAGARRWRIRWSSGITSCG